MEGKVLKTIQHFGLELDIPVTAKIQEYTSLKAKKDKKNKTKFDKFSYYKTKEGKIVKVLYRDNDSYVSLGEYPFLQPDVKVCQARDLSDKNPERLVITEAAYIGHEGDKVFVKKMKDVSVETGKIEIDETSDDLFETISVGNDGRFKQFLKLISANDKHS